MNNPLSVKIHHLDCILTAFFKLHTAPYIVTESAIKKGLRPAHSVLYVPIYLQSTKSKSDHTITLFYSELLFN